MDKYHRAVYRVVSDNCSFLSQAARSCSALGLSDDVTRSIDGTISFINKRLASPTVRVAIIGGFSSGKSSLINAIVGAQILATRMSPTTVCPTYVAYGESTEIEIVLPLDALDEPEVATPVPEKVQLIISEPFRRTTTVPPSETDGMVTCYHVDTRRYRRPTVRARVDQRIVAKRRVEIPPGVRRISLYYNALTNQIRTSIEYDHLPPSLRPRVRLKWSTHHQASDGASVSMHSHGMDRTYKTLVYVPPRCSCEASVLFDVKEYVDRYPTLWRRRRLRGLWQKLKAILIAGYRYERTPTLVTANMLRPIKIENGSDVPMAYWVTLDLSDARIDIRQASDEKSLPRVFQITTKDDWARATELLSRLTAAVRETSKQTDYSGFVKSVCIRHPADILRSSVTLIDTPGLVSESAHTITTIRMIEHEADSCLYLLPIQQAATLKDLEFVQQYLMDIADAITFVVTKVDTAHDEQEVEEVLDVVRSKLRSSLGLRNPRVIAVSAAEALRNPQSRYGVEFSKFVKDVVAFAEANRERLVVRRLISLEMSLMNAVAERVRDKEQEYQVRLDQLRHYVIEDLQSFVQRQVKDLEPALASACDLELLSNRFSVRIEGARRLFAQEIRHEIYAAKSKGELKQFCESELPQILAYFDKRLQIEFRAANDELNQDLISIFQEVFESFEESFERQYPLQKITGRRLQFSAVHFTSDLSDGGAGDQARTVSEAMSSEVWYRGVGAGTLALLGTFVLPGIGTILGALVGGLLGGIFGPSLDDLKLTTYTQIMERIDEHFSAKIKPAVSDHLHSRKKELRRRLHSAVMDYLATYDRAVQKLISEHEHKKAEVDAYLREARSLRDELNRRLRELRSMRAELKIA